MEERLAVEGAHRLPAAWPAGEHQRGLWCRVCAENRKHPSLIILAEMEKAVPCKDTAKLPIERQGAHVRHYPRLTGKAAAAHCDHGRRRIDAGDLVAGLDKMAAYRFGAAA